MSSDEAALPRGDATGQPGPRWSGRRRSGRCGRPMPTIAKLPDMAPSPLPVSTADVGAILLSKQTFLRTNLDQAIASLTADGTIAAHSEGRELSRHAGAVTVTDDRPAIQVDHVSKRYGRTLALTDVSFDVRAGSCSRCSVPTAPARPRCCTSSAPSCNPTAAPRASADIDVIAHPTRARRDVGVVFQEPSLDDRLTVYEKSELSWPGLRRPAQAAAAADRGDAGTGGTDRVARQAGAHVVLRHEASASRSPARWSTTPASCSSTNRPSGWMRNRASGSGSISAACAASAN